MINRILNVGEEFYHLEKTNYDFYNAKVYSGYRSINDAWFNENMFRIKKEKVTGISFNNVKHIYFVGDVFDTLSFQFDESCVVDESDCYETFEECRDAYLQKLAKHIEALNMASACIKNFDNADSYNGTFLSKMSKTGHYKER